MATLGTGTTITFQSGLFAEILEAEWSGAERAAIETTHFGTTGGKTFTPATNPDWGELSVQYAFDPEIDPTTALLAVAETVTLTFADDAPASTLAGSGFMRSVGVAIPFEDRLVGNAVIKLSGLPTHG